MAFRMPHPCIYYFVFFVFSVYGYGGTTSTPPTPVVLYYVGSVTLPHCSRVQTSEPCPDHVPGLSAHGFSS